MSSIKIPTLSLMKERETIIQNLLKLSPAIQYNVLSQMTNNQLVNICLDPFFVKKHSNDRFTLDKSIRQ